MNNYKELTENQLLEWSSHNYEEINCILGEEGRNRELDFDYEAEVTSIYKNWTAGKYPQLEATPVNELHFYRNEETEDTEEIEEKPQSNAVILSNNDMLMELAKRIIKNPELFKGLDEGVDMLIDHIPDEEEELGLGDRMRAAALGKELLGE